MLLTVFPFFVASAEASNGVLDDGVYRISNFYVDGAYGSYGNFYLRANGTSVNLSTEYYADMCYDLFSYWKPEHFGNNIYMIRSMANPNLVLNYGANGVELYDISTGQTPTSVYFQLSAGTAKTLKSILDVNKCLSASPLTPNQSSSYYYSSVSITTVDTDPMPFQNWIFTEADIAGLYLRNNATGELKTTATVTAYDNNMILTHEELGYTPIAFDTDITPSVTWVSSNTNVVTVSNNVSFIMQGGGQTTITGSFTDSNGVTHIVSYALSVIIVRDMYYSEYDPNKYNNYGATPSNGTETDHIQYRMNCYGYALSFIRYGYTTYYSQYGAYKQQPGEFASTANKDRMLTIYGIADNEELMERVVNNMQLDAERFGYTITEYNPQYSLVEQFGQNSRLIALVTNEGDYHFYTQHSNGTWSHKQGSIEVSNVSIDDKVILTNANIQEKACQGDYYGGELKFIVVTKTTVIDCPHDEYCCHNMYWPCSDTEIDLYLLDQAGDYIQNSKDKTLGTNTGRIDFAKDNDVYCFTPTATKTYTATVNYTTGTNTDLDCKVYNECGVQIGASTATGNVSMSIRLTAGKSYYFDIYNYTGTLTGYQFTIS